MVEVAERVVEETYSEPMQPALMAVRENRKETADTFTLKLAHPDGSPFPFLPGQFNMIGILGVGEVPISISGDPDRPEVLVHTIREVGAATAALRRLGVGDAVTVRGPYGTPWPMEAAQNRNVFLVTGGIGLAPLRPAIYSILNHRELYGRFTVLFGARSEAEILFSRELHLLRSRFDMNLDVTLDRGADQWHGNVGVVTTLIPRHPIDPENTIAMVCGPEIMIRFTVQALTERGLGHDRIYVSMERNMKCGIGLCGHCQLRGDFICRSGPVYRYTEMAATMSTREL